MRARLHTLGKELGVVDLVDGVDARDVCEAVRSHRLFCTPIVDPSPASAATSSPNADTAAAAGAARRKGGTGSP